MGRGGGPGPRGGGCWNCSTSMRREQLGSPSLAIFTACPPPGLLLFFCCPGIVFVYHRVLVLSVSVWVWRLGGPRVSALVWTAWEHGDCAQGDGSRTGAAARKCVRAGGAAWLWGVAFYFLSSFLSPVIVRHVYVIHECMQPVSVWGPADASIQLTCCTFGAASCSLCRVTAASHHHHHCVCLYAGGCAGRQWGAPSQQVSGLLLCARPCPQPFSISTGHLCLVFLGRLCRWGLVW